MTPPEPLEIVILNPNATRSMTDDMVASAQAAAPVSVTVRGLTNSRGPASIQGPQDALDCLPGLFALFDQVRAEGADAVIVGCFDDTGLGDLRARNAIPVIGLGEAGCIAATLVAPRFSVVTTLDVSVPVITANIRAMGLWPRCTGVHASGVPVLEVSAGAASIAKIQGTVDAALARYPHGSIVLGCGGMTRIAHNMSTSNGVRVIDPVIAALHLAVAAIWARTGGSRDLGIGAQVHV